MWRLLSMHIATGAGGSYAKFLGFMIFVVPIVIGMIIKLLGIAFVVYVGADLVIDQATNVVLANFNGLPADVLSLLQLAGMDTALKMIISTVGAVLTIKAFSRTKKLKFLA